MRSLFGTRARARNPKTEWLERNWASLQHELADPTHLDRIDDYVGAPGPAESSRGVSSRCGGASKVTSMFSNPLLRCAVA
jgi:hypothetical protein